MSVTYATRRRVQNTRFGLSGQLKVRYQLQSVLKSDQMNRRTTLVILLSVFTVTAKSQSPCLDGNGQVIDKSKCLSDIKTAMFDTDYFWFGDSWAKRCTEAVARNDTDCFNYDTKTRSLFSRMFAPDTLNASVYAPEVFVNVSYTSERGKFSGCDHAGLRPVSRMFTLDPLSSETHNPWDVRSAPEVRWATNRGEQYTLLVIDAGFFFTHQVTVNIPADDLRGGEMIKSYNGPRNYRDQANPYAFFVFRQGRNDIVLSPRWRGTLGFQVSRDKVTDFMREYDLQGPIGVNWLKAWYDAYSVQTMRDFASRTDNCASLVTQALVRHPRPFIPSDIKLSVFMSVTFYSPEFSFTYCDRSFTYRENVFELDPIGDVMVKAGETKSGNPLKVQLSSRTMYRDPDTDLQGDIHTLLMVDPDVPIPGVGSNERPMVHWLVRNIQNGDVTSGEVIHTYRGPMPPDQKPHTYYYLLYEQTELNTYPNTSTWAGNCLSRVADRCQFNVNGFVQDNNLRLVGATWMLSKNDEFVNYTLSKSSGNQEEYCRWYRPCPNQTAGPISAAGHFRGDMICYLVAAWVVLVLIIF